MKKILVIQTASIGDVILATPLVEKLHFHYPDAFIDLLVKQGSESLFEAHPYLRKLLVWDKSKNKYKNLFKLFSVIRNEKYDCVVNVHRFASSGFLTALSGAKIKIGFNKNPFSFFYTTKVKHSLHRRNQHEVERNLDLIRSLTDDSFFPIKLYPSQQNFAKMSQFKMTVYITISPVSLWFTKQFPFEKWIEFMLGIKNNIRIYLLGSKKDYEICEKLITSTGYKNALNLAGKLSLLESAVLMKDAQMNFMNDSAPIHLASAVNAPTTAIFCSTVPAFGFGPLADNSLVVETGEKLDCRPCGIHGFNECPKKHFKCALTIDIHSLLHRLA